MLKLDSFKKVAPRVSQIRAKSKSGEEKTGEFSSVTFFALQDFAEAISFDHGTVGSKICKIDLTKKYHLGQRMSNRDTNKKGANWFSAHLRGQRERNLDITGKKAVLKGILVRNIS